MKRLESGLVMTVALALVLSMALAWSAATAADAANGKEVFLGERCNLCHAVPAAGIEAKTTSEKMKGPDLLKGSPDPKWLAEYIRQEAEGEGGRHSKGFKGTDEELQALVDWLLEQKAE